MNKMAFLIKFLCWKNAEYRRDSRKDCFYKKETFTGSPLASYQFP